MIIITQATMKRINISNITPIALTATYSKRSKK